MKISHTDGDISDYLTGNFPNSMGIIPTNPNEYYSLFSQIQINIIYLLTSRFSKGVNDILSKIIQGLINEIATLLSIMYNKSLLSWDHYFSFSLMILPTLLN